MSEIYMGEPSPAFKKWCQDNYGEKGPTYEILNFQAVEAPMEVGLMHLDREMEPIEGLGDVVLVYSKDKQTWTDWNGEAISLAVDEKVYIRAKTENQTLDKYDEVEEMPLDAYMFSFAGEGHIKADGSVQYLLKSDGNRDDVPAGCFGMLFCDMGESGALLTAPQLPATTLALQCYYNMFAYCTSLTQAPALPATTLALQCYSYMFCNCTSLTQAPALPATTLANGCYYNMFYGCDNVTSANMKQEMQGVYDPSTHGTLKKGITINYTL